MDKNILNNVTKRLSKWVLGSKEAPQRILLYPTNNCNLKCLFCYQQLKPYDYSDIMSKEKWLNITKELCEMGVETFQISGGGESLIRADLVLDMMHIIKSYEKEGRLVTNGTLLNEKMIKEIIEMDWDNVIFSIDGSNESTHNYLRGKEDAFSKTTNNIRLFKKYKDELKKERPSLEFSTVLTNKNYTEIIDIIKLASDIGVKVITFEPVFVSNPDVQKLKLNKQEREVLIKNIPEALELANSLGIITNLETLVEVKSIEKTGTLKKFIFKLLEQKEKNDFFNMPCYEPWLWPKIEANGIIGVCSTNSLNENIKNKTFKEIWYGKEFNKFRERIMNHDLPEGCENCVSTHLPINQEIRKELSLTINEKRNN
ncbi:hypothetical protein CL621_01560 [archaeon]|nr:hypothetical protein [archaeon]|tara:strand:- start:2981 stop:4093 length:1113 start_codon:yes stop_codon:yes gene_type:complete